MAIIGEYIADTGAKILIDDSAIAGISDEEMARRWKRIEEVARQIAINTEMRRMQSEGELFGGRKQNRNLRKAR